MRGITIESGCKFKSDSKLRKLEPVLNNWIGIVQEYSKAFKDEDACWWYTERANVGILAAAAWRTNGWIALEEYSTSKRGDETDSKNGRCDLYITEKNHDNSFAFEAKLAWQTMRFDGVGKIKILIKGAWEDAGNLEKTEAKTRVAACFAIPRIPARFARTDDFDSQVLKWLEQVLSDVPWDAVAWVFPKDSRQLKNTSQNKPQIYPGVLLILRKRNRANNKSRTQ